MTRRFVRSTRDNQGVGEKPDNQTWLDSLTDDEQFWLGELCRRGMTLSQAEVLAVQPQLDRHAVREVLDRGCDPDVAFLIFAA